MGVNIYYLELMFILINFYQQQKLMKKGHTDRDLIFEEKRQEALEKKFGCKFIRINTSNAKMFMIQIMRLVTQKHLLMSSKIKK